LAKIGFVASFVVARPLFGRSNPERRQ